MRLQSIRALHDALYNARYEYEDTSMVQALNDYANDVAVKEPMRYEMTYPRYWHGYLVVLKPLLLFFNVSEIRLLNLLVQTALFFWMLWLILKRYGGGYVIPVVLMLMILNPAVLPLSLQFTWVYGISLVAAVILLQMKDPIKNGKYLLFFLGIGMVTSYFDLLTYPLITLGLPLSLLLLRQETTGWKGKTWKVFAVSSVWGVGYAVMWAGKWVCLMLFGGTNIFREVTSKIIERTAMVGEEQESLTFGMAVSKPLSVVLNGPFLIMFALVLIGCFFYALRKKRSLSGTDLKEMIPWLILAAEPFLWFGMLSNHTWVHYWFAYRELSVTVLALGMMAACFLAGERRPVEDREDSGIENCK